MPSRDPQSDKYPDRTFCGGRWLTPEQIEAQRDRVRRWVEQNPVKRRESQRRWNELNIEKKRESGRRYMHERYWADPFYPLRRTQKERERRARKQEEALRGGKSNT